MVEVWCMLIDIYDNLKKLLENRFNCLVPVFLTRYNEIVIEARSEILYELCSFLKSNRVIPFEQLIDLCCVDFSKYSVSDWDVRTVSESGFSRARSSCTEQTVFNSRFLVVYHLLSLSKNVRVCLKNFVPLSSLSVPSVCKVWPSANWFEREAYDLFGILFEDHPFLHRILTDYNFEGYPMRKDFPLVGYKELKYDDKEKKCVYVDVSIEETSVNANVIR